MNPSKDGADSVEQADLPIVKQYLACSKAAIDSNDIVVEPYGECQFKGYPLTGPLFLQYAQFL